MAIVIPYEKSILEGRGAFIKPDGEILLLGSSSHEDYAKKYLNNEQLMSKRELFLYNEWLKYNSSASDFMFYVLSYDKVEESWKKIITTTDNSPHIRFYNYYLMDWNIYQVGKMSYNPETNGFQFVGNQSYLFNHRDGEVEDEIRDIKKRVLKKDRNLFFK